MIDKKSMEINIKFASRTKNLLPHLSAFIFLTQKETL